MLIRDIEGNSRYYYEDDYMFFSFADTYSKQFNLFVTNEKKGFTWYTDTGASVKVEKPLYQGYTYYAGTDRSQKKCDLEVAAEGLSDEDIKEMLLWLDEGATGFLVVDWNRDWGYDVVLAKVTNPQQFGRGYKSVVTFKLTFQTIGEFRARAAWDITSDIPTVPVTVIEPGQDEPTIYDSYSWDCDQREATIANGYGIPELDIRCVEQIDSGLSYRINKDDPTTETPIYCQHTIMYLPTIGNQYGYLDYNFVHTFNLPTRFDCNMLEQDVDTNELKTKNNIFAYTLNAIEDADSLISYYGRSGYTSWNNKHLIENHENFVGEMATEQNSLLKLQGYAPKSLKPQNIIIDDTNNDYDIITVYITQKQKEQLATIENLYVSLSVPKLEQKMNLYGTNPYNNKEYPIQYENWIAYLPYYSLYSDTSSVVTSDMVSLQFKGHKVPEEYKNNLKLFYCNMHLYYGSYNIIEIIQPLGSEASCTVHKYNNL